jgi:hypothetical protein
MFVQLTKAFLGKPAGERIDVSDEDAKSLIAQQLAVSVKDDLITPAVSKVLESAFAKITQSLDGIINASLREPSPTPRARRRSTPSHSSSAKRAPAIPRNRSATSASPSRARIVPIWKSTSDRP